MDFYVKSLGLIIEIDGASYIGKEEYDERRENYLKNLGLVIFRITDKRVKYDLGNVRQELKDFIVKEFSN